MEIIENIYSKRYVYLFECKSDFSSQATYNKNLTNYHEIRMQVINILQIKAPEPRQHNAVLKAFLFPEHKIGRYLSTAFFGHYQHLYGAHYFDYTIFHFVHSLTPLKEPFQNCYLMFFVLHKSVLRILLLTYHMICFYKLICLDVSKNSILVFPIINFSFRLATL